MSGSTDQRLLSVAHDLRRRSEILLERYAPAAQVRQDRLVMIGDAGIMEYAASVIEGSLGPASSIPPVSLEHKGTMEAAGRGGDAEPSELRLAIMRAHRGWADRHAPHLLESWLA